MELLQNQTENHKGNIIVMKRQRKLGRVNKPETSEGLEEYHLTKSTVKVVYSIGSIAIATIIGMFGWIAVQLYTLHGEVSSNTTAIASMNTRLTNVESKLDEMDTRLIHVEDKLEEMDTRVSKLESSVDKLESSVNALNIAVFGINRISTDSAFTASMNASVVANDVSTSYSSFGPETKVGVDTNGNVLLAADLINKKVLLTYTEDDKEIYFLGQFNENYHWDGYCITNVYYSDGSLYGICESNFDNGERLDFHSFYSLGDNEWRYSDKICIADDENTGISIRYKYSDTTIKDFTADTFEYSDVLYVTSFIESINPRMISYCSGSWKDGELQDDSGTAYEVIFNDDGTVKTLYVGQFDNSTFNDSTGQAWEIVYVESDDSYYYNVGKFKNGTALDKSMEPISRDGILKLISKYQFNCELNWK